MYDKQESIYNKSSRNKKFKQDIASKSFQKLTKPSYVNSISLFNEDCLSLVRNISSKNFKSFSSELGNDLCEDSYENIKQTHSLFSNYQNFTSLINLNTISPISYTQVLNSFRGNYEEFC